MTLTDLKERVDKAEGADHDLDKLLFVATAESPFDIVQGTVLAVLGGFRARLEDEDIPSYTASIDAALALVERKLPGCRVLLDTSVPHARVSDGEEHDHGSMGMTPALAILSALLAALISTQGEGSTDA